MLTSCPVCDRRITRETYYIDCHRMGSHAECPNGHYRDIDDTGDYELIVGAAQWMWNYKSEAGSPTESGVENATILAKAAWRDRERPEGVDFHCHVCGVECPIAPDPPGRAVCEDHCEDHDYVYERSERGHFCLHCFKERPDDWYDE